MKRWVAEDYRLENPEDTARYMVPWVQDLLSQIEVPPNGRVCEIGVGSGKFSVAFATLGFKVTAVDLSIEMLKQMKRSFSKTDIEYILSELLHLAIKPEYFDLAINEGVIEHFLDYEKRIDALAEMTRISKVGGYVAVYVPQQHHAPDEHFYETPRELGLEMRDAGLTVTEIGQISFSSKEIKGLFLGIGKKT